jgi:SAM-dependent methyltransferase
MERSQADARTARWQDPDAGARYREQRFRTPAAARRDLGLVRRLLRRGAVPRPVRRVLDVPCGTGRLGEALIPAAELYVGLDLSPSMLAANPWPRRLLGSAFGLPFADDTFDLVVCCRLLHHLAEPELREDLVRELVRVSRRFLAMSFWDAGSLPALRRRRARRRPERPADRRVSLPRRALAELLTSCGARPRCYAHSFRFLSSQAFVLAEKSGQPGRG